LRKTRLPKPKIEATRDWFTITFLRPNLQKESFQKRQAGLQGDLEKVTVKVPEKVAVNQSKILEAIASDPAITVARLAAIVKISERKIKENISKLKSKGLLRRMGPDKGGHWKVLKK